MDRQAIRARTFRAWDGQRVKLWRSCSIWSLVLEYFQPEQTCWVAVCLAASISSFYPCVPNDSVSCFRNVLSSWVSRDEGSLDSRTRRSYWYTSIIRIWRVSRISYTGEEIVRLWIAAAIALQGSYIVQIVVVFSAQERSDSFFLIYLIAIRSLGARYLNCDNKILHVRLWGTSDLLLLGILTQFTFSRDMCAKYWFNRTRS